MKSALVLPIEICQTIYGDLLLGVGSRGRSWGSPNEPKMDQKWTKNEKKIIKNRIIKRYLKLALGLPMKMCQRIYGDLSRGVGSRGHSWG